ncbi:hypothetical protein [Blastochloris tepida]|nr:hypothetical protein [Blastochloris tepida]
MTSHVLRPSASRQLPRLDAATIAFLVEPGRVLILRVLFRGRDPGASRFR